MKKSKFSPMHVAFISAIVTVIFCLTIAMFVVKPPHVIGDTVTDKVSGSTETAGTGETGKVSTFTRTSTFVYLGACSKLYATEDSDTPVGNFMETFEPEQLAELIDSNLFPYRQQYVATTSSSEVIRYMIRATDGSTYWVEP